MTFKKMSSLRSLTVNKVKRQFIYHVHTFLKKIVLNQLKNNFYLECFSRLHFIQEAVKLYQKNPYAKKNEEVQQTALSQKMYVFKITNFYLKNRLLYQNRFRARTPSIVSVQVSRKKATDETCLNFHISKNITSEKKYLTKYVKISQTLRRFLKHKEFFR